MMYNQVRELVESNLRVAKYHKVAFETIDFYSSRMLGDIRHNLAHVNIQDDIKHIYKGLRALPYPYCDLFTKE